MRNRWVLATTLLLAALALSLTFLGSAPTGNVGAGALDVVVVSLSSLTIFLLPLIALLISHDAVVGEMERGTMILLLSYPVGRYQVMLGKFCGHVLILAFATVIGYGAAAAALAITGASVLAASWYAFASMLGSSILLGAVFVAIGYLISSLVRDRGTAAGISVGIWLLMVLVFDMALLGMLVVDQGRIVSAPVLEALLFLNPTDLYRMTNLTGFNVSQFSGMAGLAGTATHQGRRAAAGLDGLGRRAARACDRVLCAEGIMTLRILCAFVAVSSSPAAIRMRPIPSLPPPAAAQQRRDGRVLRHERARTSRARRARSSPASRIDPFWFSSVRDTVAFTLMPDQPRDIRAIYVSDMARAPSWEDPGATNWVDARKAFFVIDSRKQGGMGAAEAVPFGNRAAADAFAAANGGRVVTFTRNSERLCARQRHARRSEPSMNVLTCGSTDEERPMLNRTISPGGA